MRRAPGTTEFTRFLSYTLEDIFVDTKNTKGLRTQFDVLRLPDCRQNIYHISSLGDTSPLSIGHRLE